MSRLREPRAGRWLALGLFAFSVLAAAACDPAPPGDRDATAKAFKAMNDKKNGDEATK